MFQNLILKFETDLIAHQFDCLDGCLLYLFAINLVLFHLKKVTEPELLISGTIFSGFLIDLESLILGFTHFICVVNKKGPQITVQSVLRQYSLKVEHYIIEVFACYLL
jgi:hypothetical protein